MPNRNPGVYFSLAASVLMLAGCADAPGPVTHTFLAHAPTQGKVYKIAANGDIAGE